MYTFTVVLHITVCLLMIAAILFQGGKGAEIGAAFGGSSQTVFGSRGPTNFLSKVTIAAAAIFMLTSLSLTYLSRQNTYSSSVINLEHTDTSASPAARSEESEPPASTSPTTTDTPAEEPSSTGHDSEPAPVDSK